MKKIFYLIIIFFLVSSANGCKKKACPEKTPTLRDYLTQTDWMYIRQETYENEQFVQQVTYSDWHRIFTPSGDYYLTHGTSTGDYGTYVFDDESDPMTISTRSYSGQEHHYIVEQLDENTLVFYETIRSGNSVFKYVHVHEKASN